VTYTRDPMSLICQALDLIASSRAATNFGFPFFTPSLQRLTHSRLLASQSGSTPKLKKVLFNFILSEKSQSLPRSGRTCVKNLFAVLICKKTNLNNSILNLANSRLLLSTTGLTAERDVMKRPH